MNIILDVIIVILLFIMILAVNGIKNKTLIKSFKIVLLLIESASLVIGVLLIYIPMWSDIGWTLVYLGVTIIILYYVFYYRKHNSN